MLHAALKKMVNPGFTPVPVQKSGGVYTLPNLSSGSF